MPRRPGRDGCGCGLIVLIFLALVPVTVLFQVLGWSLGPLGLTMFAPVSDGAMTAWASIAQAVLLGLPLLLLGLLWRGPRYRAVFRVWLLAMGFLLVMVPTRYLLPTSSQMAMIWQIVITVLYVGFVLLVTRRRAPDGAAGFQTRPTELLQDGEGRTRRGATMVSVWLGLALAALFAYPWLAWGATGSPLDILLGLVLGLAFGTAAGVIIGRVWLRSLTIDSRGSGWDIFTGGLIVGAVLLIMGAGFGFNGSQVLLIFYLPAVGWMTMGLSLAGEPETPERNWPALALFVGLVAAMPILFMDPDTAYFAFITEGGEGLAWAFKTAILALPLAWLLGLLALLFRNRLRTWRAGPMLTGASEILGYRPGRAHRLAPTGLKSWMHPTLTGAAVALWLVGLVIYFAIGQPGFYGDKLFVVLKDQADLSAAVDMEDHDRRRQFVYDTLVQRANTTQADLRAALDVMHVHYTPYYLVNALEVEGGLLHRLWLASRPEVDRIMPSPVLRPLPAPLSVSTGDDEAPTEPQWNLTNIGADRVWSEFGVRGEGVIIGQSDSGVQADHPELADGYRGRDGTHDYNWFDPWFASGQPEDSGGHGTHTLGSILGETVGLAPDAQWYACANLARNLGNPAKYLDCMQFMLAPFPLGGDPFTDGDSTRSAHVLNNSWGCPEDREGCDPNSLRPAVKALRSAGIFVVASAGNEGPRCGTVKDPIATYDEAFSVGAVDQFGNIGQFSSMGPVTTDGSGRVKPDIIAPGVDVLSSTPNNTYGTASGTSMAGPHVAGVVALMWSANPDLIGNIERTEQILIESARPYAGTTDILEMAQEMNIENQPEWPGGEMPDLPFNLGGCLDETDMSVVPNNVVGYGVVDAYEAVRMALEGRPPPRPSPKSGGGG